MNRTRRLQGFTLIEILVALTILSLATAMLYPGFARTQQAANDRMAISEAGHVAENFRRYAAWNNGAYPGGVGTGWTNVVNLFGSYSDFGSPDVAPSVFSNGLSGWIPGQIQAGSASASGAPARTGFVIGFMALGGTGTWFCLDQNGLASGPADWNICK